jgi:hypothetical protein
MSPARSGNAVIRASPQSYEERHTTLLHKNSGNLARFRGKAAGCPIPDSCVTRSVGSCLLGPDHLRLMHALPRSEHPVACDDDRLGSCQGLGVVVW